MQPLQENEIFPLSIFNYNLVRLGIGSFFSFYKALLSASSLSYVEEKISGIPMNPKDMLYSLLREKGFPRINLNVFMIKSKGGIILINDFKENRDSIILYKIGKHYEVVGKNNSDFGYPNIDTFFSSSSPFVSLLLNNSVVKKY